LKIQDWQKQKHNCDCSGRYNASARLFII